jgi:hypothetical protein
MMELRLQEIETKAKDFGADETYPLRRINIFDGVVEDLFGSTRVVLLKIEFLVE